MTPGSFVEQAPSGVIERPVDVVFRWKAFVRSLHPLRVIAHESLRGPYTRNEFIEVTRNIHCSAAESSRIQDKSVGLWQMEKLGFAYCRHGQNTLNDAAIPSEVQPILHIGMGIASTESAEFCSDRITELIEPRTHPDFRLFPYESIGCIWAVYANKWFQLIFRFISKAKIPPYKLPTWRDFIDHFSPEVQWLISHGYGRTIYFRDCNVGRAIRTAVQLESLDTPAAVQGIAFAYAMLNCADLYRVLEVGSDIRDPALARAFRHGLTYALVFWEWVFIGFLDGLSPQTDRQWELIASARELITESRQTGRLTVFGVR
jgi:hypothetical protein